MHRYPNDAGDGWPTEMEAFGQAVRVKRQQLGLTRRALADRADISFMTLRNIEAGLHNTAPQKRARLIAQLGLPVAGSTNKPC